MKSVFQTEKECYICGTTRDLHEHHVFFGTANRKLSEKRGYKIYLCGHHHNLSNEGVHSNRSMDLYLKKMAQKHYEIHYGSREDFIREFGKSYL